MKGGGEGQRERVKQAQEKRQEVKKRVTERSKKRQWAEKNEINVKGGFRPSLSSFFVFCRMVSIQRSRAQT